MILLDTCVLLWLAADQKKLSVKAIDAIKDNGGSLYVSSISAFEIALKVRKKKLKLSLQPVMWFNNALDHHGIKEIQVNGTIAAKSVQLPGIHNDPCDRFIIASALLYNLPVCTSDSLIALYKGIKTIW